jgi:hypothetical protein
MNPAVSESSPSKLTRLTELISRFGDYRKSKGRNVSAFTIDAEAGLFYRATRAAYTRRFVHCKILIAIDQEKPCISPLQEAPNASARRILWLYMHHAQPNYPGKDRELAVLRSFNNANLLMQGAERIVMDRLNSGDMNDARYAARVMDDRIFLPFAEAWLARGKRARHPR